MIKQSITLSNWDIDKLNDIDFYNNSIFHGCINDKPESSDDMIVIYLQLLPEILYYDLFFECTDYFAAWISNIPVPDMYNFVTLLRTPDNTEEIRLFINNSAEYKDLIRFDNITLNFKTGLQRLYGKNFDLAMENVYIYVDIFSNSSIDVLESYYNTINEKVANTNIYYTNRLVLFNTIEPAIEKMFTRIMKKYSFINKHEVLMNTNKITHYTYEI